MYVGGCRNFEKLRRVAVDLARGELGKPSIVKNYRFLDPVYREVARTLR
jgi:hypothetical protein